MQIKREKVSQNQLKHYYRNEKNGRAYLIYSNKVMVNGTLSIPINKTIQIMENSQKCGLLTEGGDLYYYDLETEQLEKIDKPIGLIAEASENKHSFFITSLYGIKKDIPLAPYNTEIVTINYAMEIPIFFFDYTYPRSKYTLRPGETNDILNTAIKCLDETQDIPSLIVKKGLFNNLFKK